MSIKIAFSTEEKKEHKKGLKKAKKQNKKATESIKLHKEVVRNRFKKEGLIN